MSNQIYNNNQAYYDMEQKERNQQKDYNINNPFINYNKENINNFQKETLLQKTKNSVGNLINFNDEFQNSAQYPGEQIDEIKIKELMLPVYDKIYEIRGDLQKFSELNSKNYNKNISNRQFNEMQSLHTNMIFNKNLIDDTINYMKEKIENVHYEQIHKEFEEITSMLETLNIEMENMVNDFNNKYEKLIKEKKRQKIAQELLNGTYNKNPNMNKYDLLNENDELKIHKNIDDEEDIDYDKYKSDINELNLEKENLMIKYLQEKQKAINGLPKLVPPSEKVSFKYQIKPPDYANENNNSYNNDINNINNNIANSNNNISNSNNNIVNSNNNIINSSKNIIKNSNNDESNINNNIDNSNNINTNVNQPENNIQKKIKKSNNYNNKNNGMNNYNGNSYISNNNKKSVNYMEDDSKDDNNNINNKNMDLTETMNEFQKKMNAISNQIITGQPRKNFKPKVISSGPSKADYLRNIRPKSNGSKVTLKNFKVQKKPGPYMFENKYKKKPNKFKVGKYPNEDDENKLNDFIVKNPPKPILKKEKEGFNLDPKFLEKDIQKIVDMNVKKALAGLNLQKNKNENNNNNNNDELLKILIQKFDDIENAIRESKNNNDNGAIPQIDINEIIANEIFHKIYSQLNENVKVNINEEENESEEHPEPEQMPQKNENIIEKSDEIPPNNIEIIREKKEDELEKISRPRDFLKKFDVDLSDTSSYHDVSLKQKDSLKNTGMNLEIKKINIKENRFINVNESNNQNNVNESYNIDNSMSKGEVRSDFEEDFNIENKRLYKTDNNYFNKNKTGNQLLMLKNYNENLPENFYYNNINNINNINDSEDENEPIQNNKIYNNNKSNYNNMNNNNININNDETLKKYNFYEKDEFNAFKNNFLEKMNDNKTQSNFANISNPNYNNTYNKFRFIQGNQNLNNTMGSLKLNRNLSQENEELNKKLALLKIKNNQLSNELGIEENEEMNPNMNNINEMNYMNLNPNINNINNIENNQNSIKKSVGEDSGDRSPGEYRSDDSY